MANSALLGHETRVGANTELRLRPLRRFLLRVSMRLRRPWLDRMIAHGVERPRDHALALREAQLVGRRDRRRLAFRFERILTQRPRPAGPSSAVPIDHRAVEAAKPVLTELILTLLSSEAVEARGVVLGWGLLTDPCSPIYAPQGRSVDVQRLRYEAHAVLFALRPLATIGSRRVGPALPLRDRFARIAGRRGSAPA